jgi:hypothetical protein
MTLAMNGNGERLAQPHRVDRDDELALELGEKGSSFSYDKFFTGFEDGNVFTYDGATPARYREMLATDGKAASIEKLLSYPILSAPWEIKPVKGDKGEADWIREFFQASQRNGGMKGGIEQLIAQMTYAETIRKTFHEKVFTVRESDGKYIYDKIAWRPPETCELALNAKSSEIVGFRQMPTWQYNMYDRLIPQQSVDKAGWIPVYGRKALVYVHGAWRDPIDGISSMQVPYWCWETKRKIRFIWYQYLETTSLPKTIVKNEDEAEAIANAKKVATLRSRDVLGIGLDNEIETLESSGQGAAQFQAALAWLDNEMSNSVVQHFGELASNGGQSGSGSYALSQTLSQLFLRTRRVVARDLARVITDQIIGDLVRANFGVDAAIPQFVFGPLSEANEDSVLTMFSALTQTSQAGRMPKEFLDQLTLRVATILEMDPGKVQAQLTEMNKDIDPNDPKSMVVGTVQGAVQMLQAEAANAAAANAGTMAPGPGTGVPAAPKAGAGAANSAGPNKNTFNKGNNPKPKGSMSVTRGGANGTKSPYAK